MGNNIGLLFARDGKRRIFTAISGIFFFLAILLQLLIPDYSTKQLLYYAFLGVSILSGGCFVFIEAIKTLFEKRFLDINFLVIIASMGAIFINQLAEAAAVLFFFSLAEVFEEFGVERSKKSLEALIKRSPKKATLKSGEIVSAEKIKINDIVVVRPGELVPVDGIVVEGISSVDASSITGESVPKDKSKGDTIFAGTINLNGYLEIKVTTESKNFVFSKIIELVDKAQKSRAPIQKFIETFSRYYTPLIIILAILIAIVFPIILNDPFDKWIYRSLILLLLSCPCALVISTPVSIASAMGGALRYGILIKGGKYLEMLAKLKIIAFDKTKTLTVGKLEVSDLITFSGFSEEEVLADAAGIGKFSSHPISQSILNYAQKRGIDPHSMEKFKDISGKGAVASCIVCSGAECSIGNLEFIGEQKEVIEEVLEIIEPLEKEGKTVVIIREGDKVIGVLALLDRIKENASQAMKQLKDLEIKTIILTGDNWNIARHIASSIGVKEVYASLLPEEKVKKIEDLKKAGYVAMVGDGINDAPSLLASNVGIAMGETGTDIAIESADVALMNDDLLNIPRAIILGRKTLRIIKQNIVLSLGVKLLFLVLAVLGMTRLSYAIAADALMAVGITLYSLSLFHIKTD